jgi:hypothetical protein
MFFFDHDTPRVAIAARRCISLSNPDSACAPNVEALKLHCSQAFSHNQDPKATGYRSIENSGCRRGALTRQQRSRDENPAWLNRPVLVEFGPIG